MTNKAHPYQERQKSRRLAEWFSSPLGSEICHQEQGILKELLPKLFGHFLVYSGPGKALDDVLSNSLIRNKYLLQVMDELAGQSVAIQGQHDALPLLSDGIDVLILSHVLEFADNPHQVLREAERVLIPEGELILVGFNPWSMWGFLARVLRFKDAVPWGARTIGISRLRDWLSLLGFSVEDERHCFFRLPVQHQGLLDRMKGMDRLCGRWCRPMGSAYVLRAKKKVVILTPLKSRWRKRAKILGGVAEPTARRVCGDR